MNARGNIARFAQLGIKDTINGVKYGYPGCPALITCVFTKVMNGLIMTLEEDQRFYVFVWLADSRMEVPRYRSSPTS